jgi:hypothetical protein
MKKLALGAVVAAGVAYAVAKGRRSAGVVTAGAREVFDRVTPSDANATGAAAADQPDDATPAHKVETEPPPS